MEVMMRAWAGESSEDKWNAYLRYFNWCRVQLSEFGKKRSYPNGAKSYVATPEGIRECWTKAEEEAAKKRK